MTPQNDKADSNGADPAKCAGSADNPTPNALSSALLMEGRHRPRDAQNR